MEKPLSGVSPADKIDQKILKRLLDEGYLRIRAVKALMFTGGQSYDLAVKWIKEHENDKDIDAPFDDVVIQQQNQ